MTFGEKFREKHQDLEKRIKTKEYLDSYAKELKGMVYCHILPVVLAIAGMTLFLALGCPVCLKLCSGLPKLAQGFLEFLVVLVSVAIPVGIMFLFFKIDEARYVEKLKNSKEL